MRSTDIKQVYAEREHLSVLVSFQLVPLGIRCRMRSLFASPLESGAGATLFTMRSGGAAGTVRYTGNVRNLTLTYTTLIEEIPGRGIVFEDGIYVLSGVTDAGFNFFSAMVDVL